MINWKHLLPVLIPFSIALFAGVLGVDFGHHWDEGKLVPQLRDTIRTGTLLPGWYRYPSVVYWLNLLGLIPYILGIVSKGNFYLEDLRAYLIDVVGGDVFRIQVRWVFIFISALAIIWVYLLIYVWRNRNWIEALTGALLFGLSWEVNYHSRWIAPDAILMQFGALTMLCIVLALQPNSKRPWLWGAAIAAGLGLGTIPRGVADSSSSVCCLQAQRAIWLGSFFGSAAGIWMQFSALYPWCHLTNKDLLLRCFFGSSSLSNWALRVFSIVY